MSSGFWPVFPNCSILDLFCQKTAFESLRIVRVDFYGPFLLLNQQSQGDEVNLVPRVKSANEHHPFLMHQLTAAASDANCFLLAFHHWYQV